MFIKLTLFSEEKKDFRLNISNITFYHSIKNLDGLHSKLKFNGCKIYVEVKETPEEIDQLIKEAQAECCRVESGKEVTISLEDMKKAIK